MTEWLKVLLSNEYSVGGIRNNSKNRKFYIRQRREAIKNQYSSISAKDFIYEIKRNERFGVFKDYLNNIQTEYIYVSEGHGINHNERTALFTFYLANKEGLSDEDLKLALYAAFYHDTGRMHDFLDDYHGFRSAEMLDRLELDVTDEELDILKTVITCHSLDDSRYQSVVNKNNVYDKKRCDKLFKILKDSDALDRVRLDGNPIVIPEMLRCGCSKNLILASYQLYDNYEKIKEILEQEKSC